MDSPDERVLILRQKLFIIENKEGRMMITLPSFMDPIDRNCSIAVICPLRGAAANLVEC
jgi:hypothetical protein